MDLGIIVHSLEDEGHLCLQLSRLVEAEVIQMDIGGVDVGSLGPDDHVADEYDKTCDDYCNG